MTWTYEQATGRLLQDEGLIALGYSGKGEGKNNPDLQNVQCVGPAPRGKYTIGTPVDTVTHGPYVLPLTPNVDNDMCGRSHFLIHGDSVREPGTASEGCLIFGRATREKIHASGDNLLEVI